MVRCTECGARLVGSEPVCALHGAAPSPELPCLDEDGQAAAQAAIERALRDAGFEASSLLGSGGFGLVYGAVRASDGLEVAAKVSLHAGEEAEAEIEREAALMRAARGPHVPEVIWHGTLASRPCLVLARVRHKTLAARMAERAGSPLEFAHATRFAFGLLEAVEQIHRAGIVHLDIKPENVLGADDGHTWIVDFGLARTLGESRQSSPVEGGEPAGTAEYMSPEQCDDAADLDVRSDIYSVGIVLYELIGGAPPFWGKAADVREAQRSGRPLPLPPRPEVPPAVDTVVRGCLTKDRAQRPGGLREVRQALRQALGRHSPSLPAPQLRSVPPKEARPRRARGQSAGVKEKRTVGLLFFESRASMRALQALAAAHGGEIAHSKSTQYVIAFGHAASSNPAKPALSAAHRLIGSDVTGKVLVDVAQVTVEIRPASPSRFFGAVLTKQDRFSGATDAPAVMLTAAAVEVLPELRFVAAAGRADRFVLAQHATGDGELTVTMFGMDGAPLIGRGDILRRICDAASAATQGPVPTTFTVVGKSGYGRTHLCGTLAETVQRLLPESEVLRLAPEQDVLGQQGRVLPEMLRRLLDLPVTADGADAKALFSERLGDEIAQDVWAAAAFTLGYLDARHPEVDRLAAAPGALRWAAARAAGEALKLRARKRPQLVVLDDAHLVDDAVLDALEYATLKEDRAAIFACVFAADDFDARRPGFGTRAGMRVTAELAALHGDDAMTLARMLLHPVEHVPQTVLATLVERTQGIPRLMTELIRGLKREGIVRKNEAGTGYYVATDELDRLPDLPIVEWNARREIEALPAQLAAHARLASVLGVDFSVGEMDALASALERAGMAEDMQLDPSVGIARLVDAKILRRHRNGRFDFRSPLLRDTIYGTAPSDRRGLLHAAAFEVYEAAADMPASRRRPRLALHAARSGQSERAAQEYLALGQDLLAAQAYLPAEAAFGSALEWLGESGDARFVTAARGRGLMRFRLGRNEDAVSDLQLARERAHGLGDAALEADIMLDEATVLDWRYKVDESAALVAAAQQLVTQPDALLEVRLASNLTRVLHRGGNAERCVSVGAEAAEKAARLGDLGYEARVITLLMVAPDCCKLGRFELAEQYFETVIAQAQAHSDLHHLAAAYVNRSMLWFSLDRVDRVVRDLESATAIARKIGDPFVEANALNNLAQVLYWSGGQRQSGESSQAIRAEDELQGAAEHAARGLELALQLWGERAAAVMGSELLMARIAAYRGRYEEAARLVRSIRERKAAAEGQESGVGWGPGDEVVLEALELATSDADEACWAAHAAHAAALELQHEDRLELLECRATAALRAGRAEQGRALYAQAAELARESRNLMSGRVLRNYEQRFGTAA